MVSAGSVTLAAGSVVIGVVTAGSGPLEMTKLIFAMPFGTVVPMLRLCSTMMP